MHIKIKDIMENHINLKCLWRSELDISSQQVVMNWLQLTKHQTEINCLLAVGLVTVKNNEQTIRVSR